jgi:inorganic pyrophosphatase/exopolyphosphatase
MDLDVRGDCPMKLTALCATAVLLVLVISCNRADEDGNAVLEYLTGAEIQYETEEQKQNIVQALRDMSELSAEELSRKRYKDYSGKPGGWDLQTLLYRHVVPKKQEDTLGADFYEELKSKRVKEGIERLLDELDR